MFRTCRSVAGFALVFVAFGGTAGAVDAVPELSPGAIGSALTLLSAGALLLTSRRKPE